MRWKQVKAALLIYYLHIFKEYPAFNNGSIEMEGTRRCCFRGVGVGSPVAGEAGHGASSYDVMNAESPSGGPLRPTGVREAGEAAGRDDWGATSAKSDAYLFCQAGPALYNPRHGFSFPFCHRSEIPDLFFSPQTPRPPFSRWCSAAVIVPAVVDLWPYRAIRVICETNEARIEKQFVFDTLSIMSGTPKRLHEEGGHSTPLKRPLEEPGRFSTPPGKLNQPVGNEFHLPFEHGQQGRLAKIQRVEPSTRDIDKRSSLLHRLPMSSINSLDNPITSENRSELKCSKDARDVKSENREAKADIRDMYTDVRTDPQGSKADHDTRVDARGDEKEHRVDRGSHGDLRSDFKFEKDTYTATSSHLTWKDTKEHHRSKRCYEPASDGLESWHGSRSGLQSIDEVAKDPSTAEYLDSVEALEAVGENKVDLKGEEKCGDKDRKRKERDFGEKDKDRSDRPNNMQLGGASGDRKDLLREERDVEKCERERKDVQKDKEWNGKDPLKRELSVVSEKDNLHHEKEFVDGSVRNFDQDNAAFEPKRAKDDSWKAYVKDIKDKKRERDVDVGDRQEQHSHDKELDDGFAEGDGVTEKEKGIQQLKRFLRPRGTQTPQREARFRSRARDNEGKSLSSYYLYSLICYSFTAGKPEASAIVYKAGECMQELLKSWKEFKASQDIKNDKTFQNGPILEIRIPAEYVTSANRQVKGAQLWGTDIYTNDSDLVAVLMHTGYISPTSSRPPSSIQELRATVRVLPSEDCYTSTLRNNVRSRAWGAGIDCSFRVERCCIVKKGGGTIDLEPRLTHTSAVEPTLAPVSVERTMTTRAAASNALRHQRFVREVTIQYNLCNEPWLKYTINVVADKGLKKPLFTSARLKKGEVLYLETHFHRYELCFNGEKAVMLTSYQAMESEHDKLQNHGSHVQNGDRNSTERESITDVFRWSCCKRALPEQLMRSSGIPLPVEHLEVLEENLDWEDIQWSQTGVWVAGKEYVLARVHFLSPN
ncbi:Histone deacetylation protein Rxt3 [Musa troglodytarum]|uniref:Histone deacetylation protein Rxt3 n=1 Tax=Musa troglodytarum TaxID=320322 RepID=A0A9E7EP83_9LILI|nr:Histone deacetylation protein Rxt3 [Musa troglodytarum]